MENSTRLLWRQEESLAGRRVLVVDANDPELADLPAEQVYLLGKGLGRRTVQLHGLAPSGDAAFEAVDEVCADVSELM